MGLDTICNDPAQPCRYCPLWAQGALTALKRVYWVKRSPYLYSTRKFLPYPMWDVKNNPPPPHADTTSSLCPMGLWDQMEQTPTSGQGSALIHIYIFMEPSSTGNLRVFDMPRMDKFYYYFFSIYINKW